MDKHVRGMQLLPEQAYLHGLSIEKMCLQGHQRTAGEGARRHSGHRPSSFQRHPGKQSFGATQAIVGGLTKDSWMKASGGGGVTENIGAVTVTAMSLALPHLAPACASVNCPISWYSLCDPVA